MKLEFETNTSIVPFAGEEFVSEVNSENGSNETMQTLRAGIKAAQVGNRAEARQLLLRVTDADPNNENAWLWLASISEYPEELLIFLDNVLNINPNNERALEWVEATKSLLSKTFVQRGIDASKETHTDFAKQCFLQALVHDTQNEMAWLWLASVSDSVEEKSAHLQKVLNINPVNETAKTLLQSARRQMAETQMQKAITAAVADDRETAGKMVQDVLKQAPELEDAWVLKSYLLTSISDKIFCFKKILEFNPDSGLAQVSLISLLGMMAKAEVKPEVKRVEQVSPVEAAETAANFADLSLAKADEPEDYFARTVTEEEVLEKINQLVQVGQMADTYHFAENVGQINVPMEELDFSGKTAEEESYFEAANILKNDVPELEFDAAESLNPIEFESLDDDFNETDEAAHAEMESEVLESPGYFENYNDETDVKIETAAENTSSDTPETFEENQVSEAAEHIFPNFSIVDSESFNEQVAVQPVVEEDFSVLSREHTDTTENVEDSMPNEDVPEYLEVEDEIFTSNAAAETDYTLPSDELEEYASTESYNDYAAEFAEAGQNEATGNYAAEEAVFEQPEAEEEVFEQSKFEQEEEEHKAETGFGTQTEPLNEENNDRPEIEMLACPFCNSENESTSFVCNSCRAILTLSNLETLLAHREVDTEMLTNAVERMEVEKTLRDFSSEELKFLGIGQINLKHLRQGFSYLQAASKLNPNDVVLSSQVNALAIRLSEIEQQESVYSTMRKNRTILVVDDSATVRKLVSGKLEKCGHEVVCAIDGVDALDKINALVPDLILLDITMPRMDGYQVCKLIRSNEATKDVPIVMISGKDGFFDKVRGRMAGTTGYITKPFGPETLMKTVEAYIV